MNYFLDIAEVKYLEKELLNYFKSMRQWLFEESWFGKLCRDTIQEYRLKLFCKDGDIKEVIWNSFIKYERDGRIKGIIGFGHDVTENVKATIALKKSEERFQALIEANPDLIFVHDNSGRFIDFESGKNELYTNSNIIGKNPHDILPYELAELTVEKVKKTIETQQMQTYDYQLDRDDLKEQFFETRMVPAGKDVVLSIVRNISARKEVEDKLREQKSFLNLLLDLMPNQIFWKNLKSEYIGCNQSFAEVAGKKSPEELIGLTDHDLSIMNELADHYRKIDVHVFETGESLINYEEEFNTLQGDQKVIVTSKIPIRDNNNEVIGLLGIVIDVTKRKKNELEIQQLRKNLSNIIDSMPSILIGVDSNCKINLWNKSTEIVSGISAEEAQGQFLSDAFPSLHTEIPIIKDSIECREVRAKQKQRRMSDSIPHYDDITIYPVVASGLEGAVIRIDDRTEQVLLEEMMIQSEKMLSVGGLAAGMAHEINNPLAGMIQTANVMINRLSHDRKLDRNIKAADKVGTTLKAINEYMEIRDIPKMLDTIKDSGKRISVIVNNMLSFSRKSEGKTSTYNINDLIDKTIVLAGTDYNLKKQFDFKKIKINRVYGDNLLLICEGEKIQQVLLNILRNGAEAMHDFRTVEPEFTIKTQTETEQVIIEITDNGPGMDEEIRKRIFEPFFTTKPVGVGTGLGLSVSYFIITKNHDGDLTVESKPGIGTTFMIRLPIIIEQKG